MITCILYLFVIWVCMCYVYSDIHEERDECVYLSIHLKTSLVVGRVCGGYELIAL